MIGTDTIPAWPGVCASLCHQACAKAKWRVEYSARYRILGRERPGWCYPLCLSTFSPLLIVISSSPYSSLVSVNTKIKRKTSSPPPRIYVCMYVSVSVCVCVCVIYIYMRLLHARHLGKVGLYVGFHVLWRIEHPRKTCLCTRGTARHLLA